jgi:hypothetical protein
MPRREPDARFPHQVPVAIGEEHRHLVSRNVQEIPALLVALENAEPDACAYYRRIAAAGGYPGLGPPVLVRDPAAATAWSCGMTKHRGLTCTFWPSSTNAYHSRSLSAGTSHLDPIGQFGVGPEAVLTWSSIIRRPGAVLTARRSARATRSRVSDAAPKLGENRANEVLTG